MRRSVPSNESMEDALKTVVRDVRIEMPISCDHLRLWHRKISDCNEAGSSSNNGCESYCYFRLSAR